MALSITWWSQSNILVLVLKSSFAKPNQARSRIWLCRNMERFETYNLRIASSVGLLTTHVRMVKIPVNARHGASHILGSRSRIITFQTGSGKLLYVSWFQGLLLEKRHWRSSRLQDLPVDYSRRTYAYEIANANSTMAYWMPSSWYRWVVVGSKGLPSSTVAIVGLTKQIADKYGLLLL